MNDATREYFQRISIISSPIFRNSPLIFQIINRLTIISVLSARAARMILCTMVKASWRQPASRYALVVPLSLCWHYSIFACGAAVCAADSIFADISRSIGNMLQGWEILFSPELMTAMVTILIVFDSLSSAARGHINRSYAACPPLIIAFYQNARWFRIDITLRRLICLGRGI